MGLTTTYCRCDTWLIEVLSYFKTTPRFFYLEISINFFSLRFLHISLKMIEFAPGFSLEFLIVLCLDFWFLSFNGMESITPSLAFKGHGIQGSLVKPYVVNQGIWRHCYYIAAKGQQPVKAISAWPLSPRLRGAEGPGRRLTAATMTLFHNLNKLNESRLSTYMVGKYIIKIHLFYTTLV